VISLDLISSLNDAYIVIRVYQAYLSYENSLIFKEKNLFDHVRSDGTINYATVELNNEQIQDSSVIDESVHFYLNLFLHCISICCIVSLMNAVKQRKTLCPS
jgi:hypothetical protein